MLNYNNLNVKVWQAMQVESNMTNVSTTLQMPTEKEGQAGLLYTEQNISFGDATWILTSGFIIFTMQSGFGLIESGRLC